LFFGRRSARYTPRDVPFHLRSRRSRILPLAVLGVAALAVACARDPKPHPWVVIGIDGGEWRVIRQLWKSHQLPPVGTDREALVQQLIGAGLAEEFEVKDAEGRNVTAIRSREPNGNVRAPDANIALPG